MIALKLPFSPLMLSHATLRQPFPALAQRLGGASAFSAIFNIGVHNLLTFITRTGNIYTNEEMVLIEEQETEIVTQQTFNETHNLINVVHVDVRRYRQSYRDEADVVMFDLETEEVTRVTISLNGTISNPNVDASPEVIARYREVMEGQYAEQRARAAQARAKAEAERAEADRVEEARVAPIREIASTGTKGRHMVFANQQPAEGEIVEINGKRRVYTGCGRVFRLNEDMASMGFHPTDVGKLVCYAYYREI